MTRINTVLSPDPVPGTPRPTEEANQAKLRQACRQFEGLLYRELIHSMVAGSTEGGFFGAGPAGETWEELFESGLADSFAGTGGLKIADSLYNQFLADKKVPDPASRMLPIGRSHGGGELIPAERPMKIERQSGARQIDGVSSKGQAAKPVVGPAPPAAPALQVDVSAVARELSSIREAALKAPEVRTNLVESLRAKITAGAYAPDARIVAERLLEELRDFRER